MLTSSDRGGSGAVTVSLRLRALCGALRGLSAGVEEEIFSSLTPSLSQSVAVCAVTLSRPLSISNYSIRSTEVSSSEASGPTPTLGPGQCDVSSRDELHSN
jgi:hypothetical protein